MSIKTVGAAEWMRTFEKESKKKSKAKLDTAKEIIKAGDKKTAREILRKVSIVDSLDDNEMKAVMMLAKFISKK